MTTVTANQAVQVGDLFVDSWGYDQTNVDFYEVVGFTASGKSVRVQAIGQRVVNSTIGADYVRGAKGVFVGEVQTKRLSSYEFGGETEFYFRTSSFSSARQVGWKEEQFQTATGWGH